MIHTKKLEMKKKQICNTVKFAHYSVTCDKLTGKFSVFQSLIPCTSCNKDVFSDYQNLFADFEKKACSIPVSVNFHIGGAQNG